MIAAHRRLATFLIGTPALHRTEFVHLEKAIRPADPALHEQHRPAILDQDRRGYQQHHRRQQHRRKARQQRIEQPLGHPRAQPQRPHRHPQEPGAANQPRTMRAKLGHRRIDHLAIDIGAFEQPRPGQPAFGRAADHHPVDRMQHQSHPIKRGWIVQIRAELQHRGIGAQRAGQLHPRPSVIDQQFVDDPRAAAPLYKAAHLQPHPAQRERRQRNPRDKQHARKRRTAFGKVSDKHHRGGRHGQRAHRAQHAGARSPQRFDRIGTVVQRDGQEHWQQQLCQQRRLVEPRLRQIEIACQAKGPEHGGHVSYDQRKIALQPAPIERLSLREPGARLCGGAGRTIAAQRSVLVHRGAARLQRGLTASLNGHMAKRGTIFKVFPLSRRTRVNCAGRPRGRFRPAHAPAAARRSGCCSAARGAVRPAGRSTGRAACRATA